MARSSKVRLEARRAKISKMYLQGTSQVKIAKEMGLSQSLISKDLSALREIWKESSLRDIDELISQELAKIDLIELEYWDAWNRSKQAQEKVKKEYGDDEGKGKLKKMSKEEIGNVGNPQYLQGVERCIERRCKLLGLDRKEEDRVINYNVDLSMTKEEISAVSKKLDEQY